MQGMAEGFIMISMTTARASELTHSNTRIRIRIRIRITIIMKGADRESVEPLFLFESRSNTIPAVISVFRMANHPFMEN